MLKTASLFLAFLLLLSSSLIAQADSTLRRAQSTDEIDDYDLSEWDEEGFDEEELLDGFGHMFETPLVNEGDVLDLMLELLEDQTVNGIMVNFVIKQDGHTWVESKRPFFSIQQNEAEAIESFSDQLKSIVLQMEFDPDMDRPKAYHANFYLVKEHGLLTLTINGFDSYMIDTDLDFEP